MAFEITPDELELIELQERLADIQEQHSMIDRLLNWRQEGQMSLI